MPITFRIIAQFGKTPFLRFIDACNIILFGMNIAVGVNVLVHEFYIRSNMKFSFRIKSSKNLLYIKRVIVKFMII